ncbi:hypothetical protein F511_35753 [Dorcoceras hygrometricum]|uniref:Uncharacterized protein n=1 Tax=Dorcoceras hygrometricum TaxID=472368 RepID=A0A2Z7ARZ4_9LAMI|nr:hypothetical protein F511_35753 [Dorcoceras hygrometricum]
MSLFDLQDVCIAIGSLATLDLPMVVDLIGIYVLKGPYCTLTKTNWFFQALSVIPRGSWGDVSRRFTMIRWQLWELFKEDFVFEFVISVPILRNFQPFVLCFFKPLSLFTVTFSGHFPSIPATIFHVRGSVGLLLRSYFTLYQFRKLVFAGERSRSCCSRPWVVRAGYTAGRGAGPAGGAPGGG